MRSMDQAPSARWTSRNAYRTALPALLTALAAAAPLAAAAHSDPHPGHSTAAPTAAAPASPSVLQNLSAAPNIFIIQPGMAGTYRDHSNPHYATLHQVAYGLFGGILIPAADDPLPATMPERLRLLSDHRFHADGTLDVP